MTIIRFFSILSTLVKYGFDQLIPKSKFDFIIKFFTFIVPTSWNRDISEPAETRVRKALEELGPIYVKFGQAISTRPDLLSDAFAIELAKLQDDVTPFAKEESVEIVEKSLKKPVSEAFAEFSQEILASASIAQVHSAKLHSGEEVIVKIVRPGIAKTIKRDVSLMYLFAKMANFLSSDAKRLRLPEVVAEFEKTINDELDLQQEAANGSVLRDNFKDIDILYVPEIFWNYSSKNVLVMERVYGVPISDMETLNKNNVNLEKLAANGVTIFFTQVFYHQYFHADMHPGNIFVDIKDPENPKYIAIDFGIMGSLNNEDQHYLAENFLAFFNRDYRRVAQLHIDSGWVPSYVKVTDFEAAIRKSSEPIFGKPIAEISFGQFLITLFQTARKFDMEVQPQLILLQKTFLNIEGLGRVLYPELDLWDTGKPILEKWMRDSLGPKSMINKLKEHSGEYRDIIPKLPMLLAKSLKEQPKEKNKDLGNLTNVVLLGFVLLTISQENIWGGDTSRYILAFFVIILIMKIYKGKK